MKRCSNPQLLQMPELVSAKRKVSVAAAKVDRETVALCFKHCTRFLTPTEFSAQMRKSLRVELSPHELGAMVTHFDTKSSGMVDAVAFYREFFRLGLCQKKKEGFGKQRREIRNSVLKKKIQEVKDQRVQELLKTTIASDFSKADEKSAIEKIAEAAGRYSSGSKVTPNPVKSFVESASVTHVQFRELLKRLFLVNLTPAELTALVHIFDENNTGMIETRLFIFHFIRIAGRQQDKQAHQLARENAQRVRRSREFDRKKEQKYELLTKIQQSTATKSDRIIAERKLRSAAERFSNDKMFATNLRKCFESRSMTPTEFREMLKKNLDVLLSPGELDAAIDLFPNQNGNIICEEFLQIFIAVGGLERTRNLKRHHQMRERKVAEERLRLQAITDDFIAKNEAAIVWPTLDEVEIAADMASGESDLNDDGDNYIGKEVRPQTAPCRVSENNSSLPALCVSGCGPSRSPCPARLSVSRRPTVVEILQTDKKMKTRKKKRPKSGSAVKRYPNITEATKEFLLDIEKEEKEIRRQKQLPKKTTAAVKPSQPVGVTLGGIVPVRLDNTRNSNVRKGSSSRNKKILPNEDNYLQTVHLSSSQVIADDEVLYDDTMDVV